MMDATVLLRSATRRAKSDVANKLISMFLHELSSHFCRSWPLRVNGEDYGALVRLRFGNRCPYCLQDLTVAHPVVEHLDGMNRYRIGLHVPGNVLIACRRCNGEKRRDDSKKVLVLADTGWESFLSHNGDHCAQPCASCRYWIGIWPDRENRVKNLSANAESIRAFRREFAYFQAAMDALKPTLSDTLTKLYSDCQSFAESEIAVLLERFTTIQIGG